MRRIQVEGCVCLAHFNQLTFDRLLVSQLAIPIPFFFRFRTLGPGALNLQWKLLLITVKGLNTPEKPTLVLHDLFTQKTQIDFLKETHSRTDHIPKLLIPMVFHETNAHAKMKGIEIFFFSKHTPFQILDQLMDEDGLLTISERYITWKTANFSHHLLPQLRAIPFICPICEKLQVFARCLTILGGDFNVLLNSALDTLFGTFALPYQVLPVIKKCILDLCLHNTW